MVRLLIKLIVRPAGSNQDCAPTSMPDLSSNLLLSGHIGKPPARTTDDLIHRPDMGVGSAADDPIINTRTEAYAESFGRRSK